MYQLMNMKRKLCRNFNQELRSFLCVNIERMMVDKKGDNRDFFGKAMRVPIDTTSIDKKHRHKINLKLQLI